MDCSTHYLPYESTGYFSKIVTDYLEQSATLRPFYVHPPTMEGAQNAIEARRAFDTPRKVLVDTLTEQYASVAMDEKVKTN